jgi:hypothetical protein
VLCDGATTCGSGVDCGGTSCNVTCNGGCQGGVCCTADQCDGNVTNSCP